MIKILPHETRCARREIAAIVPLHTANQMVILQFSKNDQIKLTTERAMRNFLSLYLSNIALQSIRYRRGEIEARYMLGN